MREITLSQAVNEALAEEMRRDETVFIIGEDVAEEGPGPPPPVSSGSVLLALGSASEVGPVDSLW